MNSSQTSPKRIPPQAAARSISLPTRLHPTSLRIEQDLYTLKTLTQSPSSSSQSIQDRLVALSNLCHSINDLVRGPSNQEGLIEHALESSVRILDVCGAARELLSSLKDHVRDLQSAIRRGKKGQVGAYVSYRRDARKKASKLLHQLKQIDDLTDFAPLVDRLDLARVLGELGASTVCVFRSMFLFLSGPLVRPKGGSKWSISSISKMVAGGGSGCRRPVYEVLNEIGSVDDALQCWMDSEANSRVLQERLEVLDVGVSGLETELDALFRCLLQYRVSLLNMLSI